MPACCRSSDPTRCAVMPEKKPNILLIMADQMAAPALPIYGNTKVIAPNIEDAPAR